MLHGDVSREQILHLGCLCTCIGAPDKIHHSVEERAVHSAGVTVCPLSAPKPAECERYSVLQHICGLYSFECSHLQYRLVHVWHVHYHRVDE